MTVMQPNDIQSLFFQFPLSNGPYSFCNHHGYSIVPQTIAFGMPDDQVRIKKPAIDQAVEARMNQIVQTISELAAEQDIEVERIAPLDHGKKGVAVDIHPDYIARVQLGKLDKRPDQEWLLGSVAHEFDENLNVTVEVVEKIKTGVARTNQIQDVIGLAYDNGFKIWDQAPHNFGIRKNGQCVFIDPDGFSPIA
jgi:hypothetical protein